MGKLFGKLRDTALVQEYAGSWERTFREDRDGLGKSRKNYFIGSLLESTSSNFTAGTYSTALILILMAGAGSVAQSRYLALISMIASICGTAQLFSPVIFEPMRRRKGLILTLMAVSRGIDLFFYPLLAFLPLSVEARMIVYLVLSAIVTSASSIYNPAWSILTVHSLPDYMRGDFFTVRNLVSTITVAVQTFLLGIFMDWFEGHDLALAGLLAFRGAALLCTAIVFRRYGKMEEPEYNKGMERIRLKDIVTAPFASKQYIRVCLLHVLICAATSFSGAFYGAYLLDGAKLSYTLMGLANIISIPLSILGMPFWNRMVRKMGWLRMFALGLVLYSFAYFFNGLVTQETQWMFLLSGGYCNLVAGGWTLGNANFPYLGLPDKLKNSCVTFFNLTGVLASTVSVWIAQRFLAVTDGKYMHLFGLTLENRAYMSFVTWICMLLGALVVPLVMRVGRE